MAIYPNYSPADGLFLAGLSWEISSRSISNSRIAIRSDSPAIRSISFQPEAEDESQIGRPHRAVERTGQHTSELSAPPDSQSESEAVAEMKQSLPHNTAIAHYRLLAPIGVGGMGEVYLAEDTKLSRKVALKLLPAEFTKDAGRLRRFEQEARAASALNHPNILTIFEIGESNETHYIATEYIDGQTLREQLNGDRLATTAALDIASQITAALAAAHGAGIIHRDIKPENVMLRRDGIVKVLDFGRAKLVDHRPAAVDSQAPTQKKITDPGTVMGTVGYMSPEQVRGQETDHRADIFSFGVILYEMLAGKRAFSGESAIEVMNAIL